MAKTKNSKKGKGTYLTYKNENRAWKNKLRKFESIVNRFPNDEEAKKTLAKLKEGPSKYKHKQRPLVAGSNKTISKKVRTVPHVETIAEQLSRLLNISIPKFRPKRRRRKASVTVKKRKDVQKS